MASTAMPLVCICIPVYNAEATIAATLRSVLAQTYTNLSVLVVDNQSTDATVDVVSGFDDPRITLHRNPLNVGGEGNFNRCIQLATGKYTAIYHADDIYEPEMVAAQVDFLESHPQASAVFTDAAVIDPTGRIIGEIRQPASLRVSGPLHDFPEIFKAVLACSNFLICPSVMALTPVYQQKIKMWRGEQFASSADLDVWLRMLQYGPIGILPMKLMQYRISESQGSADVRRGTDRAAFFKVMDYYLAKSDVRCLLSSDDFVNYNRLERRDRVMRAANALMTGWPDLAEKLCPNVFSSDALRAAVQTRRGFFVLVLSAYIRGMLSLNLHAVAGAPLRFVKKIAKK